MTDTRYVKFEGTEVTAAVDTAEEAKIAIKELRHKKKELAHQKRALVRAKKGAEARAARARRKKVKKHGFLSRTRAVIDFLSSIPGAFGRANAMMDVPKIEREIVRTEETVHNIDTVMLQIEGKLLHKA